ncbi:unnamed protein product [Urochloa humidicola]
MAMPPPPLLTFLVLAATAMVATATPPPTETEHFLGVNYGTLGDNLPPPQRGMELARSAGAAAVRFYDANATLLAAAAASGLIFIPSVPNELIPSLAASRRAADAWVAATLLPYRRSPGLRFLYVGNEVLSDATTKSRWPQLVPAMANVERALRRHGLGRVKVSTTLSAHDLDRQNVFPPSAAAFRPDIAGAVMRPLLAFLDRTDSYLFFDAYTYFTWSANHSIVPLPYALLEEASSFVYPPLPPATNDRPYPGPLWCVVSTDKGPVNETAVAEQVAAACTDKAGLCDAVRPGGACYLPNTVAAHASYVFSAHWNSFSEDYGGCYFGGLAVETTVDPSHGSCRFPSIRLK